MWIYVSCACGSKLRLRDAKADKPVRCRVCGSRFRSPSAEFIAAHEGKAFRSSDLSSVDAPKPKEAERQESTPQRRAYRKRSRQAMTSGAVEPMADAALKGHSPFAHWLIDGQAGSARSW